MAKKEGVKNKELSSVMYYVHCLIGFMIMFGFGFLPPIEPITTVGMQVLGIFISLIYYWSVVGSLWPSLLGILALGISDYTDMKGALIASFGNDIVVQIIFIMAFVGAMENAGVSKHIAQWFVTRKFTMGRPWAFTSMFLLGTYVLAAATNAVAAIFLCWSILYGVLKKLGYKPGDAYSTVMVIGVVYSASLGLAAFPFKSVPLIILGAFEKASQISVDYLSYMVTVVGLSLILLLGFILIVRFVIKPDVSLLANADEELFINENRMDLKQKILLGSLFACMLGMLAPSILPAQWGITQLLKSLGASGIAMAIVVVLAFWRLDSKPILSFREVAGKGISWDLVFLAAAALSVSSALTADETGIKTLLIEILNPVFEGQSAIIFSISLIILSILLTNAATNVVVGIIFMPIIYSFSLNLGANPVILAVLVTLGLHIALMTPAASPGAALMHGNKEWLPATKQVYGYSVFLVLYTIVGVIAIGIPLANMVFN